MWREGVHSLAEVAARYAGTHFTIPISRYDVANPSLNIPLLFSLSHNANLVSEVLTISENSLTRIVSKQPINSLHAL